MPINQYCACGDVVQPSDERRQGGLTSPRRTHERNGLARSDRQGEIAKYITVGIATLGSGRLKRLNRHGRAWRIPERDIAELDRTDGIDEIDRVGSIDDRDWRVEHLEDTFETHECGHEIDAGIGEAGERLVHPRHQRCQQHQGAC